MSRYDDYGGEGNGTYRQERANPKRLYRDKERGAVCGVCAGIADYFGWDVSIVRVVTVIGMFLTPFMWIAYIILCFALPRKPRKAEVYRDEEDERFWRSVRVSPADTFRRIRHNFREMDARLQRMERYVTSRHYDLDREFRDLER